VAKVFRIARLYRIVKLRVPADTVQRENHAVLVQLAKLIVSLISLLLVASGIVYELHQLGASHDPHVWR
jgi:hypothetical protein